MVRTFGRLRTYHGRLIFWKQLVFALSRRTNQEMKRTSALNKSVNNFNVHCKASAAVIPLQRSPISRNKNGAPTKPTSKPIMSVPEKKPVDSPLTAIAALGAEAAAGGWSPGLTGATGMLTGLGWLVLGP